MDILKGKGFDCTFLGIEADRNSLYSADIVHSAFHAKIGQRNVSAVFINLYRCNRRGNFLN